MYTFLVGSWTTEGSRRSPSVVHERKKVYTFVTPTLLLGGSAALARQRAFLLENEFADDAARPG